MSISIQSLSSTAFAFHCPDFVDLYIDAMGYNPTLRHSRISVWRRAVMESGFTAVCAVESDEGHSYTYGDGIAGVAYGFLGRREHWWNRQVRRGIRNAKATVSGTSASMPDHYFELAEIHVSPTAQGQGIGHKLLSSLLRNAQSTTVLLSTPEVPNESNAAFSLYRRHGFYDLLRDFYFQGDSRAFAILRAELGKEHKVLNVG
ncbi:GNAT family N-acetyltransferase [Corynebacterium silvaticum]|uniref:GNAT family N-acetyltransferase n=1 Tax=Corynebacterium silvaticum TaxID=2320431 RepID=A0A7Y4P8D7_9CORY|nr:GNAT family N-acetyltransferase [Corynebacterium silvaticum]ARU46474.1 GNAT family N-acetyltransferase [Corynebacterium silvaticum]MBH5299617.1 GNAT family N-acetyltransferase [Corynebacterium silvaticum]NOM64064.1 GNAT family N-acetyltransferase [Corynebacterium silvaticum]NON69269.1 GNAT family N-acetyltransferase [Corynebacterium silvaticum]TFA93919.1 N-acetyltransferase [Corynebacterium silvaticum]